MNESICPRCGRIDDDDRPNWIPSDSVEHWPCGTYREPSGNLYESELCETRQELEQFRRELHKVTTEKIECARRAEKAEAEADSMQSQFERLRHDRAIALNVKTKEGLTCSEWLLRTGLAEERAEKAEAELAKRQRALEQAWGLAASDWTVEGESIGDLRRALHNAGYPDLAEWLKNREKS